MLESETPDAPPLLQLLGGLAGSLFLSCPVDSKLLNKLNFFVKRFIHAHIGRIAIQF